MDKEMIDINRNGIDHWCSMASEYTVDTIMQFMNMVFTKKRVFRGLEFKHLGRYISYEPMLELSSIMVKYVQPDPTVEGEIHASVSFRGVELLVIKHRDDINRIAKVISVLLLSSLLRSSRSYSIFASSRSVVSYSVGIHGLGEKSYHAGYVSYYLGKEIGRVISVKIKWVDESFRFFGSISAGNISENISIFPR